MTALEISPEELRGVVKQLKAAALRLTTELSAIRAELAPKPAGAEEASGAVAHTLKVLAGRAVATDRAAEHQILGLADVLEKHAATIVAQDESSAADIVRI